MSRINEISVNYQFQESNNQDLAKFAAEEVKRIEDNKRRLVEMRAKKKNMSVEEYEKHMDEEYYAEEEDQPVVIAKESQGKLA